MSNPRHTSWDHADLTDRLCRSLEIAGRVLDRFAVNGFMDPASPEQSFRPEKPIAETAVLIYAASGARHLRDVADHIDVVARTLVPHARSERVLLEMTLHPALCLHFAAAHILLTRLGYHDPEFDEILGLCLRSHVQGGHERAPSAAIEHRWLVSVWTGEGRAGGWQADLRRSALAQPIDLLGGVREDGYALTHLLMYCTDFGFRPGRLPRNRAVILDEAASLLAKCLDTEDYDLGGEALMAWPVTGAQWNAAAIFGFRLLARIEDQVGILPGGTTKAIWLNQLDGEERTHYALGTAYHTAYVMGLLCAAALLPGRAPPIRIPRRPSHGAFIDRLLPYLRRDQGHWHDEMLQLTEQERNSLATLLLDMVITQRCRTREYEVIGEVLMLAAEHGVARTPLCTQAAELIDRLNACVRVIGARRTRSATIA